MHELRSDDRLLLRRSQGRAAAREREFAQGPGGQGKPPGFLAYPILGCGAPLFPRPSAACTIVPILWLATPTDLPRRLDASFHCFALRRLGGWRDPRAAGDRAGG